MSTGGGENEQEIVVGVPVTFRLTRVQEAMAGLVREFAGLRTEITRALTVDQQIIHGPGEQIQRAVEEAANKLRLSFQAIGRAPELQTGFRNIQEQLQQITEDAEKAGQAISMTLKGPGGEGSYTLKGKQGVGEFIERLPEYARALGPGNVPLTAGISANMDPNRANLGSVEIIREELGAITAKTAADKEAEKATKRSTEQMSYWEEAIKSWGRGARPQRGFSELATGALTSLGMGQIPASLLGGAAGMIGGGAMFHIGWAITEQLSKIPERIEWAIERARTIRMTEAMAPRGEAGMAVSAAGTAKEAVSQFTGKPEDLQKIFNNLQVTTMAGRGDSEQQAIWGTLTAIAEWWRPDAGKAADISQTIQHMRQTGVGRADIAKIPFVTERLVRQYEEAKRMPPQLLGNYEAEANWIVEGAGKPEFLPGTKGQRRNINAITRTEIEAAWQTGMRESDVLKRMLGEQANRNIMAHWFEKNIAGFAGPGPHAFMDLFRRAETLSSTRDLEIARRAAENQAAAAAGRRPELFGPVSQKDFESIKRDRLSPEALDAFARLTRQTPADIKRELPFAQLLEGDISGLAAKQMQPPGMVMGPPQFSFSSLSGFANKMQTEAGVHIDYTQETAKNTDATNQHLANIERLLGGGTPDLMGSPAMGQNLNMPATYTGN